MQVTAALPHAAEDKGALGDFPRPQAGCHNGLRSDVGGCCGGHSASAELQSDVQQAGQHTRSAHQSWMQGTRQSCHRRVSNAQSRTPITMLWQILRHQGRDSTDTTSHRRKRSRVARERDAGSGSDLSSFWLYL